MVHARTVEQYIDAAKLNNRAPDAFVDLRFLGDIELEGQSAPAEGANFGGELFRATRVFIDDDAICTFSGKS